MIHSFNPSTREAEADSLCEFEASLVYTVSSRTASTVIQRNPALKNKQKAYNKKKNKQFIYMVSFMYFINNIKHTYTYVLYVMCLCL